MVSASQLPPPPPLVKVLKFTILVAFVVVVVVLFLMLIVFFNRKLQVIRNGLRPTVHPARRNGGTPLFTVLLP